MNRKDQLEQQLSFYSGRLKWLKLEVLNEPPKPGTVVTNDINDYPRKMLRMEENIAKIKKELKELGGDKNDTK